jgi:hypothetical protein
MRGKQRRKASGGVKFVQHPFSDKGAMLLTSTMDDPHRRSPMPGSTRRATQGASAGAGPRDLDLLGLGDPDLPG